MNRNSKQLGLLLVLVLVLGGAGLILSKRQSDARRSGDPTLGRKLLGDFPVNDITHVSVKAGAATLNLVKKDDLWRVAERGDYPANYGQLSDVLLKLKDLKVVQSEQIGASQLARLGLASGEGSNAAVVVEFKGQNDKPIRTVLLGKKHMRKANRPAPQFGDMGDEGWPDGRYVKAGADATSVALVEDPLANLEAKPDQWLNKDFFKVEKLRSVAVAFPVASNSWTLSRETETGEWKLAEAKSGEQLDSAKTSSLGNLLSSPSFADVVVGANPAQLGLDKPTVLTLQTFDNFTYTINVGTKTNENCPMTLTVSAQIPKERTPAKDEKAEDKDKLDKEFKEKQKKLEEKLAQEKPFEKWTYLVSSWTIDPALKERSQLLAEKKEEPKKDEKAPAMTATPPAPEATSTNK